MSPPNLFTRYPAADFPIESISLKYRVTGGFIDAELVQLTKFQAWWGIDRVWWKPGVPLASGWQAQEDRHWKWHNYVRRLRKNQWARCAGAYTDEHGFQGAIIYRQDSESELEPNTPAVYVEYVATAPWNRRGYADEPLYLGVGQGLVDLATLHSYQWGLGGRVVLGSLPRALDFYKKLNFVETGRREGRTIHCELVPDLASARLRGLGLI